MLDSKRRGRRKGIPIRSGSVLQARNEAGLTLAQVAGGVVSRAAIHLIETGRSRPSFETLELIAERTRKPLEFFLIEPDAVPQITAGHHELRELEKLTLTREFQKVVQVATPLLERQWSKSSRAMLGFYLGQAHCRLVQPLPAVEHLSSARAAFESLGDEWMAVEALDWESAAMGLLDDPRAISWAHEALERGRRLKPRSAATEARILGHIASMYVASHAWAQAMRYYEAALEAAGAVKDLLQLAKMHHGLGTVYQSLNQPARARQHFEKALALYSIESDLSAIYRVENDVGELLLQQGNLVSAEDHLRRALVGSEELGIDRKGRGYILGNLAEVALKKGDLDQAMTYVNEALKQGEFTKEQLVVANAQMTRAELEELGQHHDAADRCFADALHILEGLEMPERLRECHIRFAELLERRGDVAAASRQWRSAAELGRASPGAGTEPAQPGAITREGDAMESAGA
ncbi:MAG TPA: tetratricopeptide repeat protein [Candidatus Dormibacteraeota bacterium]|nr:tetratricopeptide repeat protein [Candidatus Dormibacteraeota bacterium]